MFILLMLSRSFLSKFHVPLLITKKFYANKVVICYILTLLGEQGWCSGESARLPQTWPRFHYSPLSFVDFSPSTLVYLPLKKPTFPNSSSIRIDKPHENKTLADVASPLNINIYLFIYFTIGSYSPVGQCKPIGQGSALSTGEPVGQK